MATKKYLDETGLAEVASHVNTRLKTVTTMPVSASSGAIRLYVGEETANYIPGHTYEYQTDHWEDITNAARIWHGSQEDWDLLSTAEKKLYDYAAFTDDDTNTGLFTVFQGTKDEWNSLSISEKTRYQYAVFTDDYVPAPVLPVTRILDTPQIASGFTGYINRNALRLYQCGNVVHLSGFFQTSGAITATLTDIFTGFPIPNVTTGHAGDEDFMACDMIDASTYRLLLSSTGGLQLRAGTIPTSRTVLICMTYLI